MDSYQVTIIAALCGMIILTRALPFFFAKKLQSNPKFKAIGRQLPAYIMLLLVIYEVQLSSFLHKPYGLPALIALGMLTIVHILKRQVLLSIAVGTVSYVLILRIFN